MVSPKPKLTRPLRKPKATWVEPKFYADVEYRDITSEGLLRASSFKGLGKGPAVPETSRLLGRLARENEIGQMISSYAE